MPHASRSIAAVVVAALTLFLRAQPAVAQPPDFAAVDSVLQEEMKAAGIPGATLAIVSGGRVVHVKAAGLASVETGEAMTPERLFRLGSTTKMFTAITVTLLAHEGRVDLRAPVGTYVKGLHPSIARVTAHQLLSHTSGILDEAPMYGSHDDAALLKNVQSWSEDRFFTEPQKIYSYSNPGYWLAGGVIESVTGKPYADAVRDLLFTPLGMSTTTFRPTVAMTYPLAQGHDVADGKATVIRPFADNAASWPAGSIFSNVRDLSRFVMAFVGGGTLEGKAVLPAKVISTVSTPAAKVPGGDRHYGYGLSLGTYRGLRLVEHGGSRSGYGSTIRMVPERQFGVVILGNRSGASFPRTAEKALEVGLGLPSTTTAAQPAAELAALTDAQMSAYAGIYAQGPRKLEIITKDGMLFLKQGARETELRRTGEHRFTPGIVFVEGADGTIEYLHIGGRSLKKLPRGS